MGQGLGAELKGIGSNGNLTKDAQAVRLFSYGVTRFADNWRIAPAFLGEYSKDRFVDGDEFLWGTVNVRLAQELTKNFEMYTRVLTSTWIWITVRNRLTAASIRQQLPQPSSWIPLLVSCQRPKFALRLLMLTGVKI